MISTTVRREQHVLLPDYCARLVENVQGTNFFGSVLMASARELLRWDSRQMKTLAYIIISVSEYIEYAALSTWMRMYQKRKCVGVL